MIICIYSVRMRLTKCQHIHQDVAPAAQQMVAFLLHIVWNPYSTIKGMCLSFFGDGFARNVAYKPWNP